MIPRKLKICSGKGIYEGLGCGFSKQIYAHGLCVKCYAASMKKKPISVNVKASQNKKKDYRLSQPYAFEKSYYMWDGKNFLTGEKIPKDELSYSNCAHILSKKQYEWFRYYTRNIVMLSPEQHNLYDNLTEDALRKRIEQYPNENWQKLLNYAYELLSEYEDWENYNYKEYKL